MRFRVLGPVELEVGGRWISAGPPKQRIVFAALCLRGGRVVSTDALIDLLWGENPPASAVKNVQKYVWQLRRLLGDRLRSQSPGYRLIIRAGELDADRFFVLVARARRAHRNGDLDRASQEFNEALALWRGPALADLVFDGSVAELARPLEVERIEAIHEFVDVETAAGRGEQLLPRLEAWVAGNRLDEPLRERQIRILLGAGRPVQALSAFVAAESQFLAELGVAPGPELQALAGAARRAMTVSLPSDDPAPLHQLPPTIPTFVGRRSELGRLAELLTPRVMSVPVVSIVGAGGVGKSTLAIRVAHRLADRFSGGQLYLDLQGTSASLPPVTAGEAVRALLSALGVDPVDMPSDLAAAIRLYRARSGRQSLLILLDNAADIAQVRPLIPITGGSAVLITSRRPLPDVDGVAHLHLETLPEADAADLLRLTLGPERVASEPDDELVRLVEACDRLPLALRVASAKLAARPSWTVTAFNQRLRDERNRLNELQLADISVRASFAISYRHLSAVAQRVFRCCGWFPGPEFCPEAIAVLAGLNPDVVGVLLEGLVDEALVLSRRPGRYRLHDLMRIYATECAQEHEGDHAGRAALAHLAGWYLRAVDAADRLVMPVRGRGTVEPGVTDDPPPPRLENRHQAIDWFEAERPNVRAIVNAAAQRGLDQVAAQLPVTMRGYLELRRCMDDWIGMHQVALTCVRKLDDRYAHARVLNSLGSGYRCQERFAEAIDCYHQAVDLVRSLGDLRTEAILLGNLGSVYGECQNYEAATACLGRALEIFPRFNGVDQSFALHNLGHVHHECGRFHDALALLEQALALRREQGNRHGEGVTLHCLADTLLGLGQCSEADLAVRESLAICADEGNRYGQAAALHSLGRVRTAQGRFTDAEEHLRQAITIYRDLGNRRDETRAVADLRVNHPVRQGSCQGEWPARSPVAATGPQVPGA